MQIKKGGGVAAVVGAGDAYRLVPGRTLTSMLCQAESEGATLQEVVRDCWSFEQVDGPLAMPLVPAEVWACGCTYAPSADFRDGELGTRDGMYSYVSRPENRPEVFFKGTSRVCVGPHEAIGIRADSRFTAPEPELGVVVGGRGTILGYTLGNDVSAWDIERENALYLPQSKVYTACCALGPAVVTPDEIPDPYALEMTCTITRGGRETFRGSASTGKLRRKIGDLIECVAKCQDLWTPTVILTGTGIIVEQDAALQPGDVCTIHVPEIGTLENPVRLIE